MEAERRAKEEDVSAFSMEDISPISQRGPMGSFASTAPSSRGPKKVKTEIVDAFKEFSTKLGKMSDVMEDVGKNIGHLASCFQHEADCAERRMQVIAEFMKVDGLTLTQVMSVAKMIALNPLEVDFFFSLPYEYRVAYVHILLPLDQ